MRLPKRVLAPTLIIALAARAPLVATTPGAIAGAVLQTLISSPLGRTLPAYHWQVKITQDRHLNAASGGDGRIFVTVGLADVLGDDRGFWAVVVSHEIGHVIILPQDQAYLPGFEKELESLYRQSGADPDGQSQSILHIEVLGANMSRLTLTRQREYEADRVGMLLMAAAGYHPDYSIAFDRRMQSYVRDQPKRGKFRLSHPRWEDREAQNAQTEKVAAAIFNARWPNVAQSPGGAAPLLAFIEAVDVHWSPGGQRLLLRIPVRFRNAAGAHLRIAVNFHGAGKIVATQLPAYRARDGTLALYASLPDSPGGAAEVSFQVPKAAFDTPARQLKAVVFVMAGEQTLGIYIQRIDLGRGY